MKKFIINIDGCDGIGKSSVIERVEEQLKAYIPSCKVHRIHYPDYESESGEYIRDLLQGKLYGDAKQIDPYKMAIPYIYNRLHYLDRVIRPNMDDNAIEFYLFDRSYISNLFYSGVRLVPGIVDHIINCYGAWDCDYTYKEPSPYDYHAKAYDAYKFFPEEVRKFQELISLEYHTEICNSNFYDAEDATVINLYLTIKDKKMIGKGIEVRGNAKDTYEDDTNFLLKVDTVYNLLESNYSVVPSEMAKFFEVRPIWLQFEDDSEKREECVNENAFNVISEIIKEVILDYPDIDIPDPWKITSTSGRFKLRTDEPYSHMIEVNPIGNMRAIPIKVDEIVTE